MAETLPSRADEKGIMDRQLSRGSHNTQSYDATAEQFALHSSTDNTDSGWQHQTDPTSISSTGLRPGTSGLSPEAFNDIVPKKVATSSVAGNPGSLDSQSENSTDSRSGSSIDMHQRTQQTLLGVGRRFESDDTFLQSTFASELRLDESSPGSRLSTFSMATDGALSSIGPLDISFPGTGSFIEPPHGPIVAEVRGAHRAPLRRAIATLFSFVAFAGVVFVAYYTLKHADRSWQALKIASVIGCLVAVTFTTFAMLLLSMTFLETAMVVLIIIAFMKFLTS